MGCRWWGALLWALTIGALTMGAPPAQAGNKNHNDFGLGLTSGAQQYGLSGKYFLNAGQAIQGSLTAGMVPSSNVGYRHTSVGLDYVVQKARIRQGERYDVSWNAGAGLALGGLNPIGVSEEEREEENDDGDDFTYAPVVLTASPLVGLEFGFARVPIDIVMEYRPTVNYVPGHGGTFNLTATSLKVRYYFL